MTNRMAALAIYAPSYNDATSFRYEFFRKFSAPASAAGSAAASTTASTAAPYRSSLRGPTPARPDSSARLAGRASATATNVASGNTTYAGTSSSAAVALRQA